MLRFRAVVATGLSIIFACTNVLFATLPQQTVWSERAKQQANLPIAETIPVVLSSQLPPVTVAPKNSVELPAAFLSCVNTQEQHQGPRGQMVVLLQDLHGNAEGQRNIA